MSAVRPGPGEGGPRVIMTLLLAGLMALSPFSIDVYLPSLPTIARELGAELQLVETTISAYLFGLMPGLLLGAPISDRFGRRRTILIGLVIFGIASALIYMSQTVTQLLVLRFVQALGAGATNVNVGAVVRDVYGEKDSARAFSMIAMISMTAPLVGPAVGTFVLHFFEWRIIFAALVVYAALMFIGTRLLLRETLQRTDDGRPPPGFLQEIGVNVRRVLHEPRALGLALCASSAFGCILVFLTDSSFVYMEYFGVSPIAFAGLFAANIVALMIFNRLNVRVLRRVGPRSILPVGLAMQATAALALVLYVFLGDPRLALVAPLIVLAVGPLGLVGANAMASYLAFFPKGTATANAILGASQYGFGALVGAGLGAIHDGTLRTLGAGMFGCSALALIAYFTLVRRRRPGRKDPQGTGRPGAE